MNWIDLEKEMPKYNERVLLLGTGNVIFIGELKEKPMYDEDGWEVEGDQEGSITILDYFSYWMPLDFLPDPH